MREPLFMMMKQSYDKMLEESTKEVKNQLKIAHYADEVAEYAKRIADRQRDAHYARSANDPTEQPSE